MRETETRGPGPTRSRRDSARPAPCRRTRRQRQVSEPCQPATACRTRAERRSRNRVPEALPAEARTLNDEPTALTRMREAPGPPAPTRCPNRSGGAAPRSGRLPVQPGPQPASSRRIIAAVVANSHAAQQHGEHARAKVQPRRLRRAMAPNPCSGGTASAHGLRREHLSPALGTAPRPRRRGPGALSEGSGGAGTPRAGTADLNIPPDARGCPVRASALRRALPRVDAPAGRPRLPDAAPPAPHTSHGAEGSRAQNLGPGAPSRPAVRAVPRWGSVSSAAEDAFKRRADRRRRVRSRPARRPARARSRRPRTARQAPDRRCVKRVGCERNRAWYGPLLGRARQQVAVTVQNRGEENEMTVEYAEKQLKDYRPEEQVQPHRGPQGGPRHARRVRAGR